MSKPIRITEEMKLRAQTEFTKHLAGLKMSDGKMSFSVSFKSDKKGEKAVLWMTQMAYRKTLALVTEFSDEVAWHGVAVRKGKNEFIIEDIIVYPQEVTGSTVNTDQEKYTEWLYKFDDEIFNKIRMQGHSHVSMGVSPSGVDDKHREKILEQLDDSMFYIFMVWNKQLKFHTLIYDMENNVLYEDGDVDVIIAGDEDMNTFLFDAKDKVQKLTSKTKKNEEKLRKQPEQHELDFGFEEYNNYHYNRYRDIYDLGGRVWNF